MSTGGISALTDIIAAFAYDLEAGRPDARERANTRLTTLRTQFANSRANIARNDSVRAARQKQSLQHPLKDFAGTYEAEGYGRVVFALNDGKLGYRWTDMYGPAEIYDASKNQLRIEISGSGNIVTFTFPSAGPAESFDLEGTVFKRVK